jgi:hypothetical protein
MLSRSGLLALILVAPSLAADLPQARAGLAARLSARQRPDGGFPYRAGGMGFADATAWSALSLGSEVAARARPFLERCRRDGGFAALIEDPDASWMTAPVLLALAARDPKDPWVAPAAAWLLDRARSQSEPGKSAPGWPWWPECAPWVEPTALTLLALAHSGPTGHPRLREGLKLIADNPAQGGGWALYAQRPHLYHTGLVLLAVHALRRADASIVREPSPYQLDAARVWLARAAPSTRTLLDLAVAVLALNVTGAPEARPHTEMLATRALAAGDTADTLSLAFTLLALDAALGRPPTPLLK